MPKFQDVLRKTLFREAKFGELRSMQSVLEDWASFCGSYHDGRTDMFGDNLLVLAVTIGNVVHFLQDLEPLLPRRYVVDAAYNHDFLDEVWRRLNLLRQNDEGAKYTVVQTIQLDHALTAINDAIMYWNVVRLVEIA